ncbi:hypothetical protein [Mycolicibacterium gadium]|uniref:hypothetical protein n=1 Tax=Mycolicibacterium gadium TaxID=1794 RepID=UPI003A5BC6F6
MRSRVRSAPPAFLKRPEAGCEKRPDNQLAYLDHGLFAQHRAVGRNNVIQCVWVYEHTINLEEVRRFHRNLGHGLLGRRVERSPLPFARHRWVLDRGPSDIEFEHFARPRAELSDWADERSQLPIDAESGAGWHLGLVFLQDGSTAVSLVLSHYLLDGLGLVVALVDAMLGNKRHLGYPPPRARPRLRAVVQDARQTVRDAPQVARALRVTTKLARSNREMTAQTPAPRPITASDEAVVVPGITIRIDLAAWDTRAKALGGTSNTLGAGLVAKLGYHLGRRRASDGAVTLQLPVNERTEGDTRANAMSFARVTLDPTLLTKDLSDARSAIKQALQAQREMPDDSLQVAWLVSFTPKRALKRMDDRMVADPNFPVFYSNLGDVGSVVNRLDGTDAEFATARVTGQRQTRRWLERMGGQMTVQSLRIPGSVVISVNAYQPGAENTKAALRELAAHTLAEFDLTGKIE